MNLIWGGSRRSILSRVEPPPALFSSLKMASWQNSRNLKQFKGGGDRLRFDYLSLTSITIKESNICLDYNISLGPALPVMISYIGTVFLGLSDQVGRNRRSDKHTCSRRAGVDLNHKGRNFPLLIITAIFLRLMPIVVLRYGHLFNET